MHCFPLIVQLYNGSDSFTNFTFKKQQNAFHMVELLILLLLSCLLCLIWTVSSRATDFTLCNLCTSWTLRTLCNFPLCTYLTQFMDFYAFRDSLYNLRTLHTVYNLITSHHDLLYELLYTVTNRHTYSLTHSFIHSLTYLIAFNLLSSMNTIEKHQHFTQHNIFFAHQSHCCRQPWGVRCRCRAGTKL